MKTIETTGTIDTQRQLVLDKPLPIVGPAPVRVIILLPEEADIDERNGFARQPPTRPFIS